MKRFVSSFVLLSLSFGLLSAQTRSIPAPPPGYHRPSPGRYEEPRHYNSSVRTRYNINQSVADGSVPDASWHRKSIETLIDKNYTPVIPRVPEDLLPPLPKRGERDPFRDETRSIFSETTRTYGNSADLVNACSQREILAIELFGYADRAPVDIVDAARYKVAEGALKRARMYVLDAQDIIGGTYDYSPVYYGGTSGSFHFSPRMDALYCKGVRYVISGVVMDYYTHRYFRTKDTKYPTFETLVTIMLTVYDLDAKEILQTKWFNLKGEGSSPEYADKNALSSLKQSAYYMIENNCKFVTGIASPGEDNGKGKLKTCTINAGEDWGVQKTDLFLVYRRKTNGDYEKIGKLKATEPAGHTSTCKVSSGGKDIYKALEDGETLMLLSDGEALF